jgi:pimeloyl-ACP methyl ester carboxylesterase
MKTSVSGPRREIGIKVGAGVLEGEMALPPGARGIVVFAHGSGSGRHSPRNLFVASALQHAGLGTLLFDLLTESEGHNRANVFDIGLLADRLVRACAFLHNDQETRRLALGLFGASTGAAAALVAAALLGRRVGAVVSRGGRPDLAGPALPQVMSPTLLIVGGADEAVIELNKAALRRLTCPRQLLIVPGATHLFEEPGTLELVAEQAARWFNRYLAPPADGAEEAAVVPRTTGLAW